MDLGLEGRRALVMAGSRGLGFACAKALHAEGAGVAICGRSADALAQAAEALPGVATITGDVAAADDIDRIVAGAEAHLGGIDILVVNAGGPPPGRYDALDDGDWARAVDLTLMSAVRAARHVLPGMRSRGWGRIVVLSSMGVRKPVDNLGLSNSIRMAVLGWAKTLARDVAADGVLVNSVLPGYIRTARVEQILAASGDPHAAEARMTAAVPVGRIGDADEVGALAAFLCSDRASYITGAAIPVDGGVIEAP